MFADLHLVALRLLTVLTSAGKVGNADCQRKLLDQVSEASPEVCASSFRTLIRESTKDLKLKKKSGQGAPRSETGYAHETMSVMMNICAGSNRDAQNYLLRQPARRETLNLVVDLVAYLTDLEPHLKAEVVFWDSDPEAYRAESHPVLDRAFGCMKVLIALSEGPNPQNQLAIVQADIIGIIARILSYCIPVWHDVIESGKHSPKRKLNAQISRLLVTLMAGDPPLEVLRNIYRGLPWGILQQNLAIKRQLMVQGTIIENDGDNKQGIVKQVSENERTAVWIARDAFKFMSVSIIICVFLYAPNFVTARPLVRCIGIR